VHYNNFCCWDFGSAENVPVDAGPGTMEALYLGSAKGGLNHGGVGPGPWIMADLEKGLFGCNSTISQEPTISHTFVTAMLKGDRGASPGHFALKGGDAQAGPLRVYWDGQRPPGYAPMKKQGSIVLGIGGDNSNKSAGTFCACPKWQDPRRSCARVSHLCGHSSPLSTHAHTHNTPAHSTDEGAIIKGYTTEATDAALQANIVAVGYKQ